MIVPEPAVEPSRPVRTVLWQRIESPGSDWCALEREPEGWRFRGIVLAKVATVPVVVQYAVAVAPDWSTRAVEIAMRSGDTIKPRQLTLTVSPDRRWQIEREPSLDPSIPQDDSMALHGLIGRRSRDHSSDQYLADPPPRARDRRGGRGDGSLGSLSRADDRTTATAIHSTGRAALSLRIRGGRVRRRDRGR